MKSALALLATLAACGFHPNGAVGGDDDGSNDGGLGSDGGAGSDSGTSVTGPCGTAGAVRDDFDDNVTAAQWAPLDAETTETGGELVATPVSGAGPAVGFGGYISRHVVDLSAGGSIDVEVTGVFDPNAKAYTEFLLYLDTRDYVGIIETNGTIFVQSALNGAGNPQASIPYDATAQKWWRLTEATDGSVTMFTSPDDATWTQLGTPVVNSTTPTWIAKPRIALTGLNLDNTTHGSTKFDNLNQDITAVPWCKSDTFVDTFNRTGIGTDWTTPRTMTGPPPPCTPTVMNGASFDQTGTATSTSCYLAGQTGLDLTSSHVTAHVDGVTNPKAGWIGLVRFNTDEQNILGMEIDQTNHLCTIAGGAPSEVCTATYDPVAHAYWRIGAVNGVVTFDASPDDANWTTIGTATVTFPLTAGELVIGSFVGTTFTMGPINFEVASLNAP